VNGAGQAAFTSNSFNAGPNSGVAQYSDPASASYAPSTASFTQDVQAVVTLGLAVDTNPSVAGSAVTFTAGFSPSSECTPGPSVSFYDGGTRLATVAVQFTPPDDYFATLSTAALAGGNHVITAVYAGDDFCTPATSGAVTQVVLAGTLPSTPAISAPVDAATAFGLTTLGATLSSAQGTPTGVVVFMDSGSAIGSGKLDNSGHTTLAVRLAAGVHQISVQYTGDGTFAPQSSSAMLVYQTPKPH